MPKITHHLFDAAEYPRSTGRLACTACTVEDIPRPRKAPRKARTFYIMGDSKVLKEITFKNNHFTFEAQFLNVRRQAKRVEGAVCIRHGMAEYNI